MRLDILGSSGTAPRAGNPASGYLVRSAAATIWMDAGPGTYMALLDLVDPESLDGVLLTHMHPDHSTDIFALSHTLAYIRHSPRVVPVIVPDGSIDRLRGFIGGGDQHPLFESLAFHEARSGETFEFGDVTVTAQAAHHTVPALAYRVASGAASLGYTGDTGPSEPVTAHFGGIDLLLAEASRGEDSDPFPFHMTARQAGAMASAAGARHLLLTHIPETIDSGTSLAEAALEYRGRLGLAAPGETYIIEATQQEDA
jgi:ribonuclease BN (tRNA processing enzyme)